MSNSTKTSTAPKNRTGLIVVIGAAIVAVLALIAVVATKDSSKTSSATTDATPAIEIGAVDIVGGPVAPLPEDPNATDPAIGTKAPTVAGQSLDGSPVSITPGAQGTVVVFVAHWCPHCQREVPKLADWAKDGTRNGVDIRAVSTAVNPDAPNYPPSAWLTREKFMIPTVADDEAKSTAEAFGLTSFPYFVAINSQGNVVARASGEIDEETFDGLVTQAKTN
jgi:cytochrome c biogenesis protein CcmG, thiol:disulfide interchange protein DsbE